MEFKLTLELIKEYFIKFNKLYFENKLPTPKFSKMKQTKPFLAGFAEMLNGKYLITFNFNKKIGWNQSLFEDVLLHEMIHFYINRNFPIGKCFQFHYWWPFWFVVKRFNLKYGLKISCSYSKELKNLNK